MVCGVALRAREALYTKRPRVSSATVPFGPRFSWGGKAKCICGYGDNGRSRRRLPPLP